MTNVTLKQLRAFVMLSKLKSFTQSAERLKLSQSALTLQIRDLETALGIRLFNRSSRSVELSEHGKRLLPSIENTIQQLDFTLMDIKGAYSLETGSVSVCASASAIAAIVAPALECLRSKYPSLSFRVIEDSGAEAPRLISEGLADIAISPVQGSNQTHCHLLLKARVGIVCAPSNTLAKHRHNPSDSSLRDQTLVIFDHPRPLSGLIESVAESSGSTSQSGYKVSSISAMLSLVERDIGIAVLSSIAAHSAVRAGLVFRPFVNPVRFRELYLLKFRDRPLTPAAAALVTAIVAEAGKLEQSGPLKGSLQVCRTPPWGIGA